MSPDSDITRVLEAAGRGDSKAGAELLPLVYDELRRLARSRMQHVPPGNTLQPTALVHEAYLRLVGKADPGWDHRGHFFAAASRAMRRILVDQARRKAARKHGGDRKRIDVDEMEIALEMPPEDVLALDDALGKLEEEDPRKAQVVVFRQFAGLDREETAAALGVSIRTVDRDWRYAMAHLHREIARSGKAGGGGEA
jgi:RNA polymerase sigma factor (TIGR02999 family)